MLANVLFSDTICDNREAHEQAHEYISNENQNIIDHNLNSGMCSMLNQAEQQNKIIFNYMKIEVRIWGITFTFTICTWCQFINEHKH